MIESKPSSLHRALPIAMSCRMRGYRERKEVSVVVGVLVEAAETGKHPKLPMLHAKLLPQSCSTLSCQLRSRFGSEHDVSFHVKAHAEEAS